MAFMPLALQPSITERINSMHNALKTIIMACLVAFPALARASYPDTITDPVLRGVLDYIDQKADFAVNRSSFSDTTSTITFSGWIDIGYVRTANTICNNPATTCSASCPIGYVIMTGYCNLQGSAPAFLTIGPVNSTRWECDTITAPANCIISAVVCARIK
jgi:hypothetical protein